MPTLPPISALPTPAVSVWIVDDSPVEAERARRCLPAGYETRTFLDGTAMLEELATGRAPDVVLLDWMMPGLSGIEVLTFVRAQPGERAELPILLLTGKQESDQVVAGLSAGANDYVSKPYADEVLRARVAALVRSKQLLERAQRAEAAFAQVLANTPDALVVVGHDGRLTYANVEAGRLFGHESSALVGRPVAGVLPGLQLSSHNGHGGVLPDVSVDGRLLAPTVRKLPVEVAVGTTISFRDITAIRKAETRRLDFYSMVAHDLRSPLSVIQLRVDLLLRRKQPALAPEVEADIVRIETNIRSLIGMINDFLDLARLEAGEFRIARDQVDMRALIEEALEDVRPLIDGKELSAVLDLPPGPALAIGDAARLRQVLANLISNAIKFTPAPGKVTVRLRVGTEVEIRVDDTGPGIAPESRSELFVRYKRALDQNKVLGTGLGLMIVREIVEAHQGSVGVDSEPGRGASFWVRLPRAVVGPS